MLCESNVFLFLAPSKYEMPKKAFASKILLSYLLKSKLSLFNVLIGKFYYNIKESI